MNWELALQLAADDSLPFVERGENLVLSHGIKDAYETINVYEQMLAACGENVRAAAFLIAVKRAARAWRDRQNAETAERGERVVKSYGCGDGYIVRFNLPSNIETEDAAIQYFMEYEYIPIRYSQYDCTGYAFTRWYKIARISGKWVCYHSIGVDV